MILVIVWAVLAACCVYLYIRNEAVYHYRAKLLGRVSAAASADIDARLPWAWRYDEFRAVDYTAMWLSFRRFDSFYPRDPARAEP